MSYRLALVLSVFLFGAIHVALGQEPSSVRAVVDNYCVNCHDADGQRAG